MSEAPTPSPDAVGARSWRWGTVFALAWLVLLVPSIRDALALGTTQGQAGAVVLVAFAGCYAYAVRGLRPVFRDEGGPRPEQVRVTIGVMLGLAVVAVVLLGELGLGTAPYLAVVGPILMRRAAFLWVVACAAATEVVSVSLGRHWQDDSGIALSTLSAGLSVWGFALLMQRQADRVRAARAEGLLALANERNRFGRDLHDILGHSLTVITVKAELAGKLMDSAPDKARAELADLERLSREALVDVRRAVEGYREITLAAELSRARSALAAAGISAQLPHALDEVPPDLKELYAWTVREGVTNVLRHSAARSCTISVGPAGISVADDGRGLPAAARDGTAETGNGIRGLQERARSLGCIAELAPLPGGGTRLTVGPAS
jgi:two-component system sensor histidine kinase DesK